MEVLDAQLHPLNAPVTPGERPIVPVDDRDTAIVATLAVLDAVGVDAVLLHPATAGHEAIDEIEAYVARAPERFRGVATIDPASPAVVEEIERARDAAGVVGLRAVLAWPPGGEGIARFHAGEFDPLLARAEAAGLPVFVFVFEELGVVEGIAHAHPGLQLVIDHIGLPQPPYYDPWPDPWADLPLLLALAGCPNVALKLGGVPTLSREARPFADVWPAVRAILDAFGADRVMWCSDFTRIRAHHSYAEALAFVRDAPGLNDAERALLLGGTARTITDWAPELASIISQT